MPWLLRTATASSNETLAHHVSETAGAARQILVLITHHFSKGSPDRGCAGFNYDTEAAIAHTRATCEQVEFMFGKGHGTVYPILCSFETDEDALVLHGRDGTVLDLAELSPDQDEALRHPLITLYPDMSAQMREDLLPLLSGNLAHIAHLRGLHRTPRHRAPRMDDLHRARLRFPAQPQPGADHRTLQPQPG